MWECNFSGPDENSDVPLCYIMADSMLAVLKNISWPCFWNSLHTSSTSKMAHPKISVTLYGSHNPFFRNNWLRRGEPIPWPPRSHYFSLLYSFFEVVWRTKFTSQSDVAEAVIMKNNGSYIHNYPRFVRAHTAAAEIQVFMYAELQVEIIWKCDTQITVICMSQFVLLFCVIAFNKYLNLKFRPSFIDIM